MTHESPRLSLKTLGKRYGGLAALTAVDLDAERGEIVGITGPSGAGKTTICRLVSGIEAPSTGEIYFGETCATRCPPQARNVAYMFESYALYPHLTVVDNIASPLRSPREAGRRDAAEINRRIDEILELTEMESLVARFPSELSGGQKQRVALCRTLVQDPAIYLLDEPISHLDAKLRHKLRGEIRRRQIDRDVPTLWFTPDAMEAMSVSDRIVVVIDGKVQQDDTPEAVYRTPANTKVAKLIGDPAMNLLPGRIEESADGLLFRNQAAAVLLPPALSSKFRNGWGDADYVLGVRPTEIAIAREASDGHTTPGEVYAFEPFGKYSIVTVQLGSELLKVKTTDNIAFNSGNAVNIGFRATDYAMFDAATGELV